MGREWLSRGRPAQHGDNSVRGQRVRGNTVLNFVEQRERLFLWLGAISAIALRAAWALVRPGSSSTGEAHEVAVAIASGRGFADAFRVGEGPTDHLMPTTPAFAGAIYSIFGIDTPTAEFILWAVATGLAVSSYLLYYRAFGRAGAPRWARLLAFWFLCLAPTYLQQESTDFRVWDGALAAFLCALFLDRLLALRATGTIGLADIVKMALLAAAAFFTKPPAGIGLYAAAGLLCITHLRGRAFATAMMAAALALALFLVPWGLRNEAVMGKFMPMRDNAGLELALSQYEGALAPIDGQVRRMKRFDEIHPSRKPYKFVTMGEVAYYQMLGADTKEWMREHPAQVREILIMHLGQIITPPPWLFRLWGSGTMATFRALCATAATILGLLGLTAGLLSRQRREWVYVAAVVLPPLLAYLLFQPLPRYIYLFYAPFAFSATGLVLLGRSLGRANSEDENTAKITGT